MYRKGGTEVEVYNEGLTVYLFDESNAEEVSAGLDAALDEGAESETLLGLAREGTLVMYELWQDEPVRVEVAVGEPLSKDEKKPARWMKLVKVPLELPTGRLRVETGASLDAPGEHAPGVVEVEPGTYEATLHRIDRSKMTGRKLEAYAGPETVLTLEPWPDGKSFEPADSLIHAGDEPRAPWVGKYALEGGVFRGQVIDTSATEQERALVVNLDRKAFDALGLARGQRLVVTAAGRDYTVLCHGRLTSIAAEWFLGERKLDSLAELHPRLVLGYLAGTGFAGEPRPAAARRYRDYDFFVVRTISPRTEAFTDADDDFNRIFALDPGDPVELRVAGEPFFELDPALQDDWRVEDGQLRARVVSRTDSRLFLNVGTGALKKLGFSDGDTLELDLGGDRRKVFDKRYISGRDWIELMEKELKTPPASNEARAKEIEAELYDEEGRFDPNDPKDAALQRELTKLNYHPDDLAHPPLTLGFMASRDFEEWEMMECRSALYSSYLQPEEIHVDVAEGDEVVVRKL